MDIFIKFLIFTSIRPNFQRAFMVVENYFSVLPQIYNKCFHEKNPEKVQWCVCDRGKYYNDIYLNSLIWT